jgi:hypothetical protein
MNPPKVNNERNPLPGTNASLRKKLNTGDGVVIPSAFQGTSTPRRVGMSKNAKVTSLHPYMS